MVKVSSKGKIHALKTGSATITASYTAKNGRTIKRKIKIKVIKPALNKKSVSLKEGKTTTLKIKSAQNTTKWKSSNTSVAKVTSKGKVTAVKKGTAYITATYHGKKYKTKVTVTAKKKTTTNNNSNNNENNTGGDTDDKKEDDPVSPDPPTPPVYVWPEEDIKDEPLYMSLYEEVDEVLAMVNTGRYTVDSFAKTKEIANYYDGMRDSYTTLIQLQADIDKYSSPKAYLVCDYKEEYNSYPEVAKLVFEEINKYRNKALPDEEEVTLQGTTVKKYYPDYIWSDNCAQIAKLQDVYNLRAKALYPDKVDRVSLHGGSAIGYAGRFINAVTDEEKWYQVTGADGLAKVSVQAFIESPLHLHFLRSALSEADVEDGLKYYCGVSVNSYINDEGWGHIKVIVKVLLAPDDSSLLTTFNPSTSTSFHRYDGIDIPLGTTINSPECQSILSGVRDLTEASVKAH